MSFQSLFKSQSNNRALTLYYRKSPQHTDMNIPLCRKRFLETQNVSKYHYKVAQCISQTATYMQLEYPYTNQINDVTNFDMTDESHRIRTYNANWDQTLFDIHDLANEGFFSLSHTSLEIQCFSCGLILTRFSSNVSIFAIHFIRSSHCLHLYEHDPTNKPILPLKAPHLPLPPNDDNFLTNVKTAGFIHIKSLQDEYYKCPSCFGRIQNLPSSDDPWIIHAKRFPFCSYIIQTKSKHFVKSLFNQEQPHQTQATMYSRNLQNQVRTLDSNLITLTVQQMLTAKSTSELLSLSQIQHDRFITILQYYSISQTKPVTIKNDAQFHALHQQLNCVICMDNPRNAIILPCTHYIACADCLKKTGKTVHSVELPFRLL